MSERDIIIDTPTHHRVTICDICNQDIDRIREYGVVSSDYYYILTVHDDLSDSDNEEFDICSLACLQQWIEKFQKRKLGLK